MSLDAFDTFRKKTEHYGGKQSSGCFIIGEFCADHYDPDNVGF